VILVDTSVIIHYLRTWSEAVDAVLDSGQAGICGVTRAEVLHGARGEADMVELLTALDELPQITMGPDIWDELGRSLCTLRSRGLAVSFPDALIATVAAATGLELWTYDAHFTPICSAIPSLRLFDGPRA
jgi:predicted nucleic acid-binding protein